MTEAGQKKITFQYKISPNYILHSTAGVHGGLNARGEIIANFFSERQAIPRRVTHELAEDGRLVEPPIEMEQTTDVIRNVNFGISITSEFAKSLAEWLVDKANEFDRLFKEKQKEMQKNE